MSVFLGYELEHCFGFTKLLESIRCVVHPACIAHDELNLKFNMIAINHILDVPEEYERK